MSPLGDGDAGTDSSAVLLSTECRSLRRALRPLVWVILEEVALDAVAEDGVLVARTSARLVAERLAIDPGTAAAALRELRGHGLVRPSREKGPAGRFGLSIYELGPVAGLSVIQPRVAEPFMVSPSAAQPARAEPAMVSPFVGRLHVESPVSEAPDADRPGRWPPRTAEPDMVASPAAVAVGGGATLLADSARRSGRGRAPGGQPAQSLPCPAQGTFDLGWASS